MMGAWMPRIVFDIAECFETGRSGAIELGVTALDHLASALPPKYDLRQSSGGAPQLVYDRPHGSGDFRAFDLGADGRATRIHITVRGNEIPESALRSDAQPEADLDCGPFRTLMNGKSITHWATLVDALGTGSLQSFRPVLLSADARSDLRIINVDCRLGGGGRQLHLAFEPRLIADRNKHACRVQFEYCIERVRLFAAGHTTAITAFP